MKIIKQDKEETRYLHEDTGCDECGKKPSSLFAVHPLNPIKIVVRKCEEHNPFKRRGKKK